MKIHLVKQGDTLHKIAEKYGVTVEEIVKLNPEIANPDAIDVGMKVKIPGGKIITQLGDFVHQHVVKQGDTLWKLAQAWGIQLSDMIKANPQLKNPNALLTGEVVNIPKVGGTAGAAAPGKASTGPAGAPGKTFTGPVTDKKETAPVLPPMPAPMPKAEPELVKMPAPPPVPDCPPVAPPPVPKCPDGKGIDLFQQFHVPATEAFAVPKGPQAPVKQPYGHQLPLPQLPSMETQGAQAGIPCPPGTVPVQGWYGQQGVGMHGFGYPGAFGYGMPQQMPPEWAYGYGHPGMMAYPGFAQPFPYAGGDPLQSTQYGVPAFVQAQAGGAGFPGVHGMPGMQAAGYAVPPMQGAATQQQGDCGCGGKRADSAAEEAQSAGIGAAQSADLSAAASTNARAAGKTRKAAKAKAQIRSTSTSGRGRSTEAAKAKVRRPNRPWINR